MGVCYFEESPLSPLDMLVLLLGYNLASLLPYITFLGSSFTPMASICINLMMLLDLYLLEFLFARLPTMSLHLNVQSISVTASPKGSFPALRSNFLSVPYLCKWFHCPLSCSGQKSWLNTNFSILIILQIESISKYCPFYYLNFHSVNPSLHFHCFCPH